MVQHQGPQPGELDDGIILVLTGEGWGKSAAAFGYLGRAWARGWHACVVQFVKGASWNVAERALADHLGVEWHTFSAGMTWGSSPDQAPATTGARAWEVAADRLHSGEFRLVVLDELGNALDAGWVELDAVLAGLKSRHRVTNVIVTGKEVPAEVCELADTVSVLHRGQSAQRGILR